MRRLPCTLLLLIIMTILLSINEGTTVLENKLSLANILQYNTILFPLTTVSDVKLVSERCHTRMQELQHGILERSFWALKGVFTLQC